MAGVSVLVIRADARDLPLPDESVDLIVTSPPYFGLRSYTDGGVHYAGQLGSEATPAAYVQALVACTTEWVRVLKPSGSIFVNLGDKYSGAQQQNSGRQSSVSSAEYWRRTDPKRTGIPAKSLLGLPWRYALAVTDQLGLILRAEIIWAKPNGLPESVQDRVRRAHEQVFHFTRQPRYYSAVDEIREAHADVSIKRAMPHRAQPGRRDAEVYNGQPAQTLDRDQMCNPLGKLPASVWSIPSQPLTVPAALGVDHFAAFPMELPRRLIAGWSPREVCTGCGQGRRPVTVPTGDRGRRPGGARTYKVIHGGRKKQNGLPDGALKLRTITGHACACSWIDDDHDEPCDGGCASVISGGLCDCGAPLTTPGVVLDPFGGTGTTALLASVLGRHAITADLSADYCRIAAWRTQDRGEIARAMQVDKPPPVPAGQDALFTAAELSG